MDGKGGIVNYFVFFWIFQISAFVVFRFMNLVNSESSLKSIIILFVIVSIGYTFLYFVKKNGDRKRAMRKASAEKDVKRQNRKKR